MGGLSIWHWLIVMAIVLVVFGTKKLRNIGSDVGGAVKSFKEAMKDGEQGKIEDAKSGQTIEGEVKEKTKV